MGYSTGVLRADSPQSVTLPPAGCWGPRALVLALFALSGASGLVYEVVWTRLLTTVLGNTVYAAGTVLSAYMAGLGLGSFWGGRLADRRPDPLRVFGLIECALGPVAFYLTLGLAGLTPAYVWLHRHLATCPAAAGAMRIGLAFAMVAVPTVLMGATLPVLSRAAVGWTSRVGLGVGMLYAANTLGAAAGCYAAGFWLIGSLGLQLTAWAGAAANVAVGLAALAAARRSKPMAVATDVPQTALISQPASSGRLVLAAVVLSGFTALGYEVLWTRVLVLFMGNTVYAFSAMLATFLTGLGLGSLWVSRRADRWGRPLACLGLMHAGIGLYALLTLWFFAAALAGPASAGAPVAWSEPAVQFLRAFAIMLVPTLLFGAAFPVAVRVVVQGPERVGRGVGAVCVGSTLGSIAGAAGVAFVLLPAVGVEGSLCVLAAVNVALGAALCGLEPHARPRARAALVGLLAAAAVATWWARPKQVFLRLHEAGPTPGRVIHYRDDAVASVCVKEHGRERALLIDNMPVAGTREGYRSSQKFLGHLPMLVHRGPVRSAFVLGFGAGGTCYSLSTHPGTERIDSAELCPGVVAVAGLFEAENHGVISKDNVHLAVMDGRHFLQTAARRYDVISVDLLLPQSAGAGSLYTEEFYRLCRSRLAPGGIMVEWVPPHRVSLENLRTIVRTLRRVFGHTALWFTSHYNHLVLVASTQPLTIDLEQVAARMAEPAVNADLAEIGIDSVPALLGYFLAGHERLGSLAGPEGPTNTDDLPLIEYRLPVQTGSVPATVLENLLAVAGLRESIVAHLTGAAARPDLVRGVETHERATAEVLRAIIERERGRLQLAVAHCRQALRICPTHREAAYYLPSFEAECAERQRGKRY